MEKCQKTVEGYRKSLIPQQAGAGIASRSRPPLRKGGIGRRILALLMCLSMLLSMSGVNTLTTFAAEKVQSTDDSVFIFSGEDGEKDKNSEDKDSSSKDQSVRKDKTAGGD